MPGADYRSGPGSDSRLARAATRAATAATTVTPAVAVAVVVALAAAAAGLASFAAPASAARGRSEGAPITITGLVTDGRGTPLPQVEVVLEASRVGFNLKRLRAEPRATQRIVTPTNARGEYSLDWPWSRSYNRFALLVQIPVRENGKPGARTLQRQDVTQRLRAGRSPVVVALSVEDVAFLESLRAFLASLETDDERRAYDLLGRPDAVDHLRFADGVETSWWYFRAGKVVRFRDGRFLEESAFDPIRPF